MSGHDGLRNPQSRAVCRAKWFGNLKPVLELGMHDGELWCENVEYIPIFPWQHVQLHTGAFHSRKTISYSAQTLLRWRSKVLAFVQDKIQYNFRYERIFVGPKKEAKKKVFLLVLKCNVWNVCFTRITFGIHFECVICPRCAHLNEI